MKKLLPSLAGFSSLLSLLLPASAISADDPAVNRLLASQCAQCHGTNGYSENGIEGIAGEEAKDMYGDLTDMKGEDKPENIMDHQALGYSDDQIRRIASYYATLPEDAQSPEEESSGDRASAVTGSALESEEDESEEEDHEEQEEEEEEEEH